ncbi:DUF3014 domain-containing protein [Shewanella yunxiaonensis]|uniref:DUF3014 domain-containing protein n=1 Tax=Shewanella yunxiaonensis TaxID=2829809 RepID=A0ABX7YSS1_9GAMM|nr:DUF3014 domain-containing protein [Shewanella yunxiaonensis]QUN05707.1 DUF3014 domain-containing protein [Shewanella yunxiaonensis]
MQVNEEDRIAPGKQASGGNGVIWVLALLVIVLAGGGWYYLTKDESATETPQQSEEQAAVSLPDTAPEQPLQTEAPVPEPEAQPQPTAAAPQAQEEAAKPAAEQLPALADSDKFVHDKVVQMADGMNINPLLNDSDMVRQFVVFVDNLAQGELARKTSPMKAPTQKFTVSDITNKTYLDPDSYHRYDVYADFLSGLDDNQLLATYKQMSPLLEQAFAELGYPNMTFNQRLHQAMKVLLGTPIVDEPIELYSISVNYKFVDPKLEALPNAQKLLIRMGPDNTRKIKKVLRQLQTLLPQ